jgi:L-fuconolactonase
LDFSPHSQPLGRSNYGMMRIDAHQHFWQYDAMEYGWINDDMAALRRDFLPAELEPLLRQSGFDGCIAVQARQTLEETRWLLELAGQHDFIRGVVGWVDLRSDDLPNQLREFASNPKLRAVRHIVQAEPDDEFMLGPDFQRGIASLADYNLAYDVLVYPRQLRAASKLAAQFPAQRFVLDHIAKPLIAQGAMDPWQDDVRALAERPNVWCKVSGMVTEAHWKDWRAEDFHPYLDVVFKAFGPQRILIGSDWPVCTVAAPYSATMGIVTDYIADFPCEQQDAILGENCAAFYRLLP